MGEDWSPRVEGKGGGGRLVSTFFSDCIAEQEEQLTTKPWQVAVGKEVLDDPLGTPARLQRLKLGLDGDILVVVDLW